MECSRLPVDVETEQNLLACLMLDPVSRSKVLTKVASSHLSEPRFAKVFGAVVKLAATGKLDGQNDLIVIRDQLADDGLLEDIGGVAGIMTMADVGHIEKFHVDEHIKRTLEFAKRREVLRQLAATGTALENGATSTKVLQSFQAFVLQQHIDTADRPTRDVREVLQEVTAEIEERAKNREQSGITTGYDGLDAILHGWRPGGRYLIGARPSEGKSTLCTRFAYNAAQAGAKVLFFSVEVDAAQFAQILWAQSAGVNSDTMQTPWDLTDPDWSKMADAINRLSLGEMSINDDGHLTLDKLIARTMAMHASSGVDLVIVDYLQRMRTERGHSRQTELAGLSAGICTLAQHLNVPILCACQLNREVEKRNSPEPRLSDLRECGDFEQDFDTVLLLWNEYSADAGQRAEQFHGKLSIESWLAVKKNRFGRRGRVKFEFRPWLREHEEVSDA